MKKRLPADALGILLVIVMLLHASDVYGQKTSSMAGDITAVDTLIKQKNWTEAEAQLDRWIAQHPADAQAQFKRATVLVRLGRLEEATTAFETLITHYPELPEPYNNLAVLQAQAGRLEAARATLEKAVRAHPGFALAYQNLGTFYLQLAAQAYQRAATLNPQDALSLQRQQQLQAMIPSD
jgi:Flp pilus assembly protein TadD